MTDLLRIPYEISLHNIENYPYIFPKVSLSKLKKLRMTDIALYSMITSDNAEYLVKLIKQLLSKYNIKLNTLNGLDLGCNTGGILYYLLNECKHMTGIEFEPLHVEICYDNIKILNKKLLDSLTLIYGDVEEIFMGNKINISNLKYYNSEYVKANVTNNDNLKNIDLVYIGTPFIDLQYGNTRVELLIVRMIKLYKPTIIIVQLPCSIYNDTHKMFYKKTLNKLLNIVNHLYDISLMLDFKQNNKCSNLHLILIKKSDSIKSNNILVKSDNILVKSDNILVKSDNILVKSDNIFIKNQKLLQNILRSTISKYNISCYSYIFNILNIWRDLYAKSYYINVFYNNKKLVFNSITRNKTGDIEKTNFSVKYNLNIKNSQESKNIKCKVKYDRFNNKIMNVSIINSS